MSRNFVYSVITDNAQKFFVSSEDALKILELYFSELFAIANKKTTSTRGLFVTVDEAINPAPLGFVFAHRHISQNEDVAI